jgi:hypothetical protein
MGVGYYFPGFFSADAEMHAYHGLTICKADHCFPQGLTARLARMSHELFDFKLNQLILLLKK